MIVILLFNIFSTSSFVINSNQATAEVKRIFLSIINNHNKT